MAADTPMARLLMRIEQAIGSDLRQREGELARWLATHCGLTEPAELEAFGERLSMLSSPELAELVHRFTVPHTRFFREAEQLAAIELALAAPSRPVVQIWVAGCATGEEAYSVALLCHRHGLRVEIVASDINTRSLGVARTGRYPREVLHHIEPQYHDQLRIRDDHIEMSPDIRRRVHFVEHNLLQPPLKPDGAQGWDLILCRNVLIYFRPELATETLRRIGVTLVPGGCLMVGVSEFHLKSPGLVPTRLAERILLQRPASPGLTPELLLPVQDQGQAQAQAQAQVQAPSRAQPLPPVAADRVLLPSGQLAMRLLLGRLDAVLEEALAVLVRDPEQQPALFLAGVAYHLKERHLEAAALLERTLHQQSTCWPAAYFLALSQEALARAEAAQLTYGILLHDTPPTPEAKALIELLELQPWKNEALAFASRRAAGSPKSIPTSSLRAERSRETPEQESPTPPPNNLHRRRQ